MRSWVLVVAFMVALCSGRAEGKKYEVMTADCQGNIHLLHSAPIGTSFAGNLASIVDFGLAKLKARFGCKCDQADGDTFATKYGPSGLLKAFSGDIPRKDTDSYDFKDAAVPGWWGSEWRQPSRTSLVLNSTQAGSLNLSQFPIDLTAAQQYLYDWNSQNSRTVIIAPGPGKVVIVNMTSMINYDVEVSECSDLSQCENVSPIFRRAWVDPSGSGPPYLVTSRSGYVRVDYTLCCEFFQAGQYGPNANVQTVPAEQKGQLSWTTPALKDVDECQSSVNTAQCGIKERCLDRDFSTISGTTGLGCFCDRDLCPFGCSDKKTCQSCETNDLLDIGGLFEVDFPSSCSYATYAKDGCKIKMTSKAGGFKADLLIAAKECPNSLFPYISVVVDGGAMNDFVKPCGETSHCTEGLECIDMSLTKPFGLDFFSVGSKVESTSPSRFDDDSFKILRDIGMYDENDKTPGCYTFSTAVGDLRKFLVGWMFGSTTDHGGSSFKFCAPRVLFPTTSPPQAFDAAATMKDLWGLSWTSGSTPRISSSNFVPSWDGSFADSTEGNIFAPARMDGSAFGPVPTLPTSPIDILRVFGMFCDMSMYIQIGKTAGGVPLGWSWRFVNIQPLLDFVAGKAFALQTCRATARGFDMTKQVFAKFFQIWSPWMWMGTLTSYNGVIANASSSGQITSKSSGPAQTVYGKVLSWLISTDNTKIEMVKTCNEASYYESGCKVQYTGLDDLLGLSAGGVIPVLGARECSMAAGSNTSWPELHFGVKGTAITAFSPLKTCNITSKNCNVGLTCTKADVVAEVPDIFNLALYGRAEGPDENSGKSCESAYVSKTSGQRSNKFVAEVVGYLTGTEPNKEASNLNFCLPQADFPGVPNRVNDMIQTKEKTEAISRDQGGSIVQFSGTRKYVTLTGLSAYDGADLFPTPSSGTAGTTSGTAGTDTGTLEPIIIGTITGGSGTLQIGEKTVSVTSSPDTNVVVSTSGDKLQLMVTSTSIPGQRCTVTLPQSDVNVDQKFNFVLQEAAMAIKQSPPADVSTKAVSMALTVFTQPTTAFETTIDLNNPARRQFDGLTLNFYWLDKLANQWVPICDGTSQDLQKRTVSATVTSTVQDNGRFNPPKACQATIPECNGEGGTVLVFAAPKDPCSGNSLGAGAIAGIVIGSVAGVLILCGAGFFLFCRQQMSTRNKGTNAHQTPPFHGQQPQDNNAVDARSDLAFPTGTNVPFNQRSTQYMA